MVNRRTGLLAACAGVLVLALLASPAQAQLTQLTASVNGTLFFVADDGASGPELWKSDGTEAGTVRVKDIWPGAAGSDPFQLTVVGATLFFSADDGTSGRELWKSDGTETGTVRVRDIRSGAMGSHPGALTTMNGLLFFTADDGETGREIWRSNGTEPGTTLLKDVEPGLGTAGHPLPGVPFNQFQVVGQTLFFLANSGAGGIFNEEIWKSDGTEIGTVLVRDLGAVGVVGPCGLGGSNARTNWAAVGSTLFFTSDNAGDGCELWKSDGTEAGTVQVKDIRPGPNGSSPGDLTNVNGTLFFIAFDGTRFGLWKTDGTELGTVLVRDPVMPGSLAAVGGMAFFISNNELWKSDGLPGGTMQVKDINPGPAETAVFVFPEKAAAGGALLFTANDGASGFELWRSDGTEAGTARVKDVQPGGGSAFPRALTPVGGLLFFAADSAPAPPGEFSGGAKELWKTDGTEAGTVRVKAFEQGSIVTSTFLVFKRLDAWYGSVTTGPGSTTDGLELTTHTAEFLSGQIAGYYPDARVTSEIMSWADTFDPFTWVSTPSEGLDAEQTLRDSFAAAVAGLGPGILIFDPPAARGTVAYDLDGLTVDGVSIIIIGEVTYRELNARFVPCEGPACVDHFLCYKTKSTKEDLCSEESLANVGAACETEEDCGGISDETAFCIPNKFPKGLQVALADQFETKDFDVKKPVGLCTPADKNGEGILDPATHLMGFQIKAAPKSCVGGAPTRPGRSCAAEEDCGGTTRMTAYCRPTPKHVPRTGLLVENQFGSIRLDTIKPDRLLVPATKGLTAPVPAPDPRNHGVDHFTCYRVKPSKGTPKFDPIDGVTVADQFTGETAKLFDLKKPTRLCTPADKNGEGIKNAAAHLLCYQAKPVKGQPRHAPVKGLFVAIQFGHAQVDTKSEEELCVPSTKQVSGGE